MRSGGGCIVHASIFLPAYLIELVNKAVQAGAEVVQIRRVAVGLGRFCTKKKLLVLLGRQRGQREDRYVRDTWQWTAVGQLSVR